MYKTVILVMIMTIILVLVFQSKCDNFSTEIHKKGLKPYLTRLWEGPEKTVPTPHKSK